MHLPPTGGSIERDRFEFYVARAMKTRFVDGTEITPSEREMEEYDMAMARLFAQRAPPKAYTEQELFPGGHLCVELFYEALTQVNSDSNPGYPLVYLFKENRDVDIQLLYLLCDELLLKWKQGDLRFFESLTKTEMFEMGLSYPSMCFVKGEPTDEAKIARLIYGVSLVMNIIGRVLTGSYLTDMSKTWRTAQHKVGMDFVSVEGLQDLMRSYQLIFKDYDGKVGANDVQGWEYQVRLWMSQSWYENYIKAGQIEGVHRHLLRCYFLFESRALMIDSDGFVHDPPFFFMRSGKPGTHTENSDARAALADMVNGFFDAPPNVVPSITNGDDCNERIEDPSLYGKLGFVITDEIETTFHRTNFCSQIIEEQDGVVTRYPDGLAKLLYSVIVKIKNVEAVSDVLMHCRQHPGFMAFYEVVRLVMILECGEETVELPKHLELNAD